MAQPAHRGSRHGQEDAGLTINAAAEKIIRQELQRLGAPTRLLVFRRRNCADFRTDARATRRSIQEAALANPLVSGRGKSSRPRCAALLIKAK